MYFGTKLESEVLREFEKISVEEGFVKLAEKEEVPSKEKYNVTDETGEDEVKKAHPDGGNDIALSGSNWGKVETIVEQNNISQQIATSNPTGKLAYTLNVLFKLANAVDTDGLESEDNEAFEMSAVIDEAINKIVAVSKVAFTKVDELELAIKTNKQLADKAMKKYYDNMRGSDPAYVTKLRDEAHKQNRYVKNMEQELALLKGKETAPIASNTSKTEVGRARSTFINQQANTSEIRYFIREIARNTNLLPEKFFKTVRRTGPFNQAVFYPLAILEKKNQVTLPPGWKNVFFGKKGPSAQETIDAAFPRLSSLVEDFEPGEGVVSAPMGIGPLVKEDIKMPKREKGLARTKDWLDEFRTPAMVKMDENEFEALLSAHKRWDIQQKGITEEKAARRDAERRVARERARQTLNSIRARQTLNSR